MSVALPAIERELGASLVGAQWTVTAYALAFAVLVLVGGRLTDVWGACRMFPAATGVLIAGTLACALAPSIDLLVGARVVQGAGAALMSPAAFRLVVRAFPAGSERGLALGTWTAAVAGGAALIAFALALAVALIHSKRPGQAGASTGAGRSTGPRRA